MKDTPKDAQELALELARLALIVSKARIKAGSEGRSKDFYTEMERTLRQSRDALLRQRRQIQGMSQDNRALRIYLEGDTGMKIAGSQHPMQVAMAIFDALPEVLGELMPLEVPELIHDITRRVYECFQQHGKGSAPYVSSLSASQDSD